MTLTVSPLPSAPSSYATSLPTLSPRNAAARRTAERLRVLGAHSSRRRAAHSDHSTFRLRRAGPRHVAHRRRATCPRATCQARYHPPRSLAGRGALGPARRVVRLHLGRRRRVSFRGVAPGESEAARAADPRGRWRGWHETGRGVVAGRPAARQGPGVGRRPTQRGAGGTVQCRQPRADGRAVW